MKQLYLLLVLSMFWIACPEMHASPASDTTIPIDVNSNAHIKWYIGDLADKYTIDFADINAAMKSSDVKEGDTLFICMKDGNQMSGEQTVSKKVVVCGSGYSITATTQPLYNVYMNAEVTEIMNIGLNSIFVNNNNVKISNCYINGSVYANKTSNENDKCTIHGCFIKGFLYGNGTYGSSEWTLTNNIIRGMISGFEDIKLNHNTIVTESADYAIKNLSRATVTNNILYTNNGENTVSSCTDCTFTKNVIGSKKLSTIDYEQNTWCETLAKIICCTGDATSDSYYKAASGGYAIKYSTDGTDCGAFGGEDSYLIGGIKYVDKTPLEKRLAEIDAKIAALKTHLQTLESTMSAFNASFIKSTRVSAADKENFETLYEWGKGILSEAYAKLQAISSQRAAIVLPENITQVEYDAFEKQISDVEKELADFESIISGYETQAATYLKMLNKYLAALPRIKWYVGDKITDYKIDFKDINAAMASDEVIPGDTLQICMMEGSQMGNSDPTVSATYQTVTKAVVITGNGFSTTATKQPIYGLTINAAGTTVKNTGVYAIYIDNDNVTVSNCCVTSGIDGHKGGTSINTVIHGCYLGLIYGYENSGWTITNNIIRGPISYLSKSDINHNTFVWNNDTNNKLYYALNSINLSTITNNVVYTNFEPQYYKSSDCTFDKNIFNRNPQIAAIDFTKNKVVETLSNIILCKGETTSEDYYRPTGESLNYSTDGTDCGAFGGTDPYLLGGTKKATPIPEEEVEPNDLLALQNIYDRYNGVNWTTYKWNVKGTTKEDYPGVSFTTVDGSIRVQEIAIPGNNLSGDVTNWIVYLPYLTLLNISGNALYGDVTKFVSNLSRLKTLIISSTMISGLTSLPASVESLERKYLNMNTNGVPYSNIDQVYTTVPTLTISDQNNWPRYYESATKEIFTKYSILTYNLTTKSLEFPVMDVYTKGAQGMGTYLNTQTPVFVEKSSGWTYSTDWTSPLTYKYDQDYPVYLVKDGSVFPVLLKYIEGDANMDGKLAINDVQTEINKIIVPNNISLFNYSAANTYLDDLMNVQDVVCTVNLLLTPAAGITSSKAAYANTIEVDLPAPANVDATVPSASPEGTIYTAAGSVRLSASKVASAIDIELQGISTSEVGLMLNRKDFQMVGKDTESGAHLVIYSLSGKSIPAGDTQILSLSHSNASILAAELSTPEATVLNVSIENNATGIENINDDANTDVRKFLHNGRIIIKTTNGTYTTEGSRIK